MDEISCTVRRLSRRWTLTAAAMAFVPRTASAAPRVKALAFDAFPIFDPRAITRLARDLVPHQGEALATAWLAKLFGYTWLATAGERYETFADLADAALRVTAAASHVDLTDDVRSRLLATFAGLEAWQDVLPALDRLKAEGVRLCLLSNLGEATLRADMRNAGVSDRFEAVLSTDRVRRFKPSPTAYAMAIDALGLAKQDIGFVAFGGWDAVGATWFGYRTAWINRLDAPAERLDAQPEIVTRGIEGALRLAGIDYTRRTSPPR